MYLLCNVLGKKKEAFLCAVNFWTVASILWGYSWGIELLFQFKMAFCYCIMWNCSLKTDLILSEMHRKINNIFGSFSSIPTPSRPQDTGNWIQFWVVGLLIYFFSFWSVVILISPASVSVASCASYRDELPHTHPKAEIWNTTEL